MVFSGHVLGLVLRMLILQRAPVSTLYETFVFVALIAVGIALLLECLAYNILGLLVASVSGYLLLSIAGRYAMDGDTFRVLQAVLDSNFWLSTHVVTITMGYAICCVAGLLGHVYLFQSVYPKVSEGTLKQTARLIYGVLAAGLLFSFLGTILGGIWADQSWGRFWGWDPKENGALLIVLWCATLFHARMGGMIRDWGFAAGAIFGNISVMLAWFGINLLGVGLHSYGFTEGIAKNLYLFIAFEVVFVGVFAVLERRGRQVTMNKERVKQNEQQ
jgi:ABC-type transport system involved in cytochrome c biogenesis permease subunit